MTRFTNQLADQKMPFSSRRWVRWSILVVVCLIAVVGVYSLPVVAESSLSREEENLIITPDSDSFNSEVTNVEVIVDPPSRFGILDEGFRYEADPIDNGSRFIVNTAEPASGSTDQYLYKKEATIVYTLADGKNVERARNMSLFHIDIKENVPILVDSQNIYLRYDQGTSHGITPDTRFFVESSGKLVTGSINQNRELVVINKSQFTNTEGFAAGSVNILTSNQEIISSVKYSSEIRSTGDELILWHPFIQQDTEYTVTVENTEITKTAERPGVVSIGNISSSPPYSVSVESQGTELLTTQGVGIEPPQSISAQLGEDRLSLHPSLRSLHIQSALLRQGDEVKYISGSDTQTVSLAYSTPFTPEEALLSTPSGLYQIKFSTPSNETSALSILKPILMLLLLVGPGILFGAVIGNFVEVDKPAVLVIFILVSLLNIGPIGAVVAWIKGADLIGTANFHLLMYSGAIVGAALSSSLVFILSDSESTETNSKEERFPTPEIRINGKYEQIEINSVDGSLKTCRTKTEIPETLRRGETKIRVKYPNGYSRQKAIYSHDDSTEFWPPKNPEQKHINVIDDTTEEPISDASISLDSNDGEIVSPDVVTIPSYRDELIVEVDHEDYESNTQPVTRSGSAEFKLSRLSGQLNINSYIDGQQVGDLDINMSLQEDQLGDQVSKNLYIDDSGHTSIETRWGDYVITSEEIIGLEHYSMSDTTVSLSPNMAKSVKLYIEFNYKHPDSTLNSISEIREDIEFITNESYDVVIPSYYASVAETILEFVETIPNRGQFFIDTSYTPTEMTEAYLSAASELVSVITETMRSKRNVDLFVACEDMPATEIDWDSDELPRTFLSPFGENQIDKSKLRDDIRTRHRDMDDFINEKKQAVNETSPVSEMHQNVTKVMQIDTQSEAIEVAHTIAVAIMLDAIEESFDHEEIMDRLSQTVF